MNGWLVVWQLQRVERPQAFIPQEESCRYLRYLEGTNSDHQLLSRKAQKPQPFDLLRYISPGWTNHDRTAPVTAMQCLHAVHLIILLVYIMIIITMGARVQP